MLSHSSETETAPAAAQSSRSLPGFRRNGVWRTIQITLQIVFVLLFRYRVQGTENYPPHSGALLLINHQSYLDPMLVGLPLNRPVSYLARNTLFGIPVIGWILRNTYVMPINRDAAGTESIRLAISRMQEGFLVGIFPEGTRTMNGEIGELKPGFVALARRADVPVIPVGISGAFKAMPRGSLLIRPASIGVFIGQPIDPKLLAELTTRGREADFVAEIRSRLIECHTAAQRMLESEHKS